MPEERERARAVEKPPFAFISPDSEQVEHYYGEIIGSLSDESKGVVRSSESGMRQLIAINHLFSSGYDSFAGAKLEFLRRLRKTDIDAAERLSQEWGIQEDVIERYERDIETIERIDEITTDSVAELGSDSLSLEAYAYSLMAEIAAGGEVNRDTLERLAKILKVFSIGKTDVFSHNEYPLHNALYAIEACLKDILFWQEFPRVYDLANDVTTRITGIDPTRRYNIQVLTDLAKKALRSNGLLAEADLRKDLQVVGSVAPVKSTISELIEDEVVGDSLQRSLGSRDFRDIEDALAAGDSMEKVKESIIERGFAKYDKFRCRICIAEAELFDDVVRRIESKRRTLLRGRAVVRGVGIRPSDPHEILEQVQAYMRLTYYEDGKPVREKEPIDETPHSAVLEHMTNLPPDCFGYAATHIRVPIVVDTSHGKKLPILEVQVRFGGRALDVMYAAAEAVYDTDGDYSEAGISARMRGAICAASRREARDLIGTEK